MCSEFDNEVIKNINLQYESLLNNYKSYNLKDNEIEKIIKYKFNERHYLEKKIIIDNLTNLINIIKIRKEKEQNVLDANFLKNDFLKYDKNFNYIYIENVDGKLLFTSLVNIINEKENFIYFVINKNKDYFQYYLCTNENNQKKLNIDFNIFFKDISKQLNGKGGGKPHFIQGSFPQLDELKINLFINEANKRFG